MNECESCFESVCEDAKLLDGGAWRVGSDGRMHWVLELSDEPRALCGVRVLITVRP